MSDTTVASALHRKESRGAHSRVDHVERDDKNWLKHSFAFKNGNSVKLDYKKTMFVFMPFPFSSVCDKEICELRDYQESFMKEDTNTVLITVGASPTNNQNII